MVSKEDPEQPLAPAVDRIPIDDDNHEPISADFILPTRQQGCIKCCGCVSALLLILSLISLVLLFTLFRIKDPILKLNSFALHNLNTTNNSNFTIVIDVSVKNPNIAAFEFGNGTTVINYGDTEVGHGWNSGGIVEAGRTLRMNTTVEVMGWKLLEVSTWKDDMKTGEIRFNGYIMVGGRVKIGNLLKKHVTMNCIFTVNLKTMVIEDQKCNHKVPVR